MNSVCSELPPLGAGDLSLLKKLLSSQGLPAQLRAITAKGPLTVVSAGAGTGKTWTLAWRFVWTALTRQDVRRILTLTFTEKAAGEMRGRIAGLLSSLEPDLRASKELSCRRAQALQSLDQAYISTIHGFGARVIGEAGLSLPVEPSPRLLSDPESEEFWSELSGALDRLESGWFIRGMDQDFASAAKKLLGDPDVANAVTRWGPDAVANFARAFEGLMSDLGCTPETILDASRKLPDKAFEVLRSSLRCEYSKLGASLAFALDVDPDKYKASAFSKRFAPFREKWLDRDITDPVNCRAFVDEAAEVVTYARGNFALAVSEAMGEDLSEWRKRTLALRPLAELANEGFSEEELRLRSLLTRLAWLCWRKWDAFKAARGSLTFSDMISLAQRALRTEPRYASRFAEVLVDEFQDTNEQQDGLLSAIRAASGARLFIVGDLKQSIYRFRHAEPALLEKYIAKARNGGGDYIDLSVSFRSGEEVLSAVNRRFEKVWKTSLGEGLNVPYQPLKSPRSLESAPSWIDERQRTELPVCVRLMEEFGLDKEGNPSFKREDVRDGLARRLACLLSDLHLKGAAVWGGKALRPVSWGDMAVLTPTRSAYDSLRRAFSRAGIPAVFSGSRSFYSRTEIRDVCALIQFIADPRDATAAAGFLCSPFSGLPQDEAQALLPKLLPEPMTALARACPDLARRLSDLRRTALMRGPSSAAADLLAHGECLKNVHPLKRAGVVANLRRAVLLLEEYESGVGASPIGAAAYLRRAMRADTPDPEAAVESGGDVVTVMTIHGSKGLEFPLVTVFGLEYRGRRGGGREGIIPSRSLMAVASDFPEEWDVKRECRLAALHRRLEDRAEYEERQRLYYVALTRARDGLILCGIMPKNGEYVSEGDRSLMSVECAGGEFVSSGEPVSIAQVESCRVHNATADGSEEAKGADFSLVTERQRLLSSVSATSFALWSMCPAAWRMRYRQNLDLSWEAEGGEATSSSASAGGAGLGTVAHWILSGWNFTPGDYHRILGLDGGCLRPEFRGVWRDPRAKDELAGFLASFETVGGRELLDRLRASLLAGTLRREFQFRVPLERFDLVGAVDVFWVENDGSGRPARLCVRDYKTTRTPQNGSSRGWMDDFYSAQLKFYAFALRRAFPEYAALDLDLALWNLREGVERRLEPFAAGEESLLEDALKEQARQAATGPWPENARRCDGCVYAGKCVFTRKV